MIKDGFFGTKESISLLTFALVTKVLFGIPSVIVQVSGNAAWYIIIISTLISLLFFYILCVLMKRFPNKNIVEVFNEVMGKFIGTLISVLFVTFLIYYTGASIREFVEMIKAYNLPGTATSIILITFIAVCLLGVYLGLETIARLSYIFFYGLAGGLILMFILAYNRYKFDYLFPFWGYGLKNIVYTGILRSSYFIEVFFLSVIINSLQGYKNFKRVGVISLILSGITMAISLFCYLLAFGFNMGQESVSGIFQLSRLIYINRFFQRVETIFLFVWVISSLIQTSFYMYVTISMYCKAFRIKKYRPLLLPLASLVYFFAILPSSLTQVFEVHLTLLRRYSFIFVYGTTLLVLIVAFIRGKKGEVAVAKKS